MKKTVSLFAVVAALAFTSCKKEEKKEAVSKAPVKDLFEPAKCSYTVDTTQTVVKWTAFKTSAKIGVGGQFDQVSVSAKENTLSVADLLSSVTFSINTSSTNTTNPDRDKKIVASFFGTMVGTENITGAITAAEGTAKAGTCTASLTLNTVKKEVPLNYVVADHQITLTGAIDINNFNGQDALAALNKVCEALHTGDDGKSITWPNVDVNITIPFVADCK